MKTLSLEELSKICAILSKKNQARYSFFKEIEDELLGREIEGFSIDIIDRFLYGFSHANLGSPRLFTFFQKLLD